jgi:hypothetical protein
MHVEEILDLLIKGECSFDNAVRMILTLKAQGHTTDKEIELAVGDLVIEGRGVLHYIRNSSLHDEVTSA